MRLDDLKRMLGGRMPNEKALRNASDRIAAFRAFCPVSREEAAANCRGCPLASVSGLENVEDCALAWLELPSARRSGNGQTAPERREKARARMRRLREARRAQAAQRAVAPLDTADAPPDLVWTNEYRAEGGHARLAAVAAIAMLALVVAGCARLAALRDRDDAARGPRVVEAPCLDAGAFAFRARDARGRERLATLDVAPADLLRIGAGGTAPVVDEGGAPCGTVFGWRATPSNLVAVAALDARGRAAWRAGATNLDARLTVAADFSGSGTVRCAPLGVAVVALSREPHTFNLRKGRKE